MANKQRKYYLFASDFDQTLTFNDTGYVLSELLGISTEEFERRIKGMAKLNLVQQGAELSYLLLHDPEFRTRARLIFMKLGSGFGSRKTSSRFMKC